MFDSHWNFTFDMQQQLTWKAQCVLDHLTLGISFCVHLMEGFSAIRFPLLQFSPTFS